MRIHAEYWLDLPNPSGTQRENITSGALSSRLTSSCCSTNWSRLEVDGRRQRDHLRDKQTGMKSRKESNKANIEEEVQSGPGLAWHTRAKTSGHVVVLCQSTNYSVRLLAKQQTEKKTLPSICRWAAESIINVTLQCHQFGREHE